MMEISPVSGHAEIARLEQQLATLEELSQPLPEFAFEDSELKYAYATGHVMGRMAWAVYTEVYRATHDSLTGLSNRAFLIENLNRCAEAQPGNFSLIFMDLDGLKQKNDMFGHEAGDRLIQEAADKIEESVRTEEGRRPADLVARIPARLGGDEFALLLPDVGTEEDLKKIEERIQSSLKASGIQASLGGRPHRVGETGLELLADVDKLMYVQKQAKKQESHRALPLRKRAAARVARILNQYAGIAGR